VATLRIGDGTTKPTGVSWSPDGGTIWFANGRANEVMIVDVATRNVTATIPVGARPWGLALSPDGRTVYTADGRSNAVSVIDVPSRSRSDSVVVGERPYGVIVAP
jgi:YVTN family beta-propeller protein